MKGIYLLLGTNLGERLGNLKRAAEILETFNMTIVDYSSVYESAPWGKVDQPWFLNMVLRVDTLISADNLLDACMETERRMGRIREEKWGERIIDVDILYTENEVIEENDLIVPHPGIADRKFTLMPLAEIAPNEVHPTIGKTNTELLKVCKDTLECKVSEYELIL
ncbi:2-amino-4-hydroxy-6-hydroxymethyldihydropteridine diphosphokinase [Marinoscillum pacificum]|uniref:2-amino-4-hydroxy-6- hydroxymethyldihydropteridine diphosphokinase n=1 Tax=Marinoscillum pacificum TaxID=392723 RepID=UPI0021574CB7|nr:2-amino-4-hydroxy-6-hydroxymethyldihydropteridine diphosphokinase [Marinoscillum pacificum]